MSLNVKEVCFRLKTEGHGMFVNEKNAREEKIENSREPKTKYRMETKTCGIVMDPSAILPCRSSC